MSFELRDYQQEALAAIETSLAAGKRPILALPTGAGKTLVAAAKIRAVVRDGGRALFLVHRDELKNQAQATLAREIPDTRIGVLKAEQREYDAPVVIASIQTAWRPQHLARLGTDFQVAIVDEAHHATASTWRTIVNALGKVPLFGLTATPFRADGGALIEIFDEVAYQKTIVEMIRPDAHDNTYLCDVRGERIKIQADFNKLHSVGGEINQGESAKMLLDADAPAEIVAAYQQHAMGRKALVFTPTIEVAEIVAERFRRAGIASEAISDNCEPEEQKNIIRRLRMGQTPVVTNCTILTEGFDCPDVSCIIIARPTRSKVLYIQMIGRGTRKAVGKRDLLVLDTTGASERHDLHTLGSLFGIKMRPNETLMEASERERSEREEAEMAEAERGKLVAHRIEMIRAQTLHWATAPEGDLFVLSFGKLGSVRLVLGESGLWTLVRQYGADQGYDYDVWDEELDLADATALAESMATDIKVRALVERNSWWRSKLIEPGSGQCVQADKARIKYSARTTKGELSDKLSLHFARRSEGFRTGKRKPVPFWVKRRSA
jgi:ATP-dependent helicase IRC3